ncbi:MAG: DUF3987 domain-containing protein [Nostoc sp. NMS7]|uniref:DUF3987 domain-containing protein n=1 Tax=Nostoc sp. NMS7 TaxID=2815391 RepID=UPI0025F61E30|nr:DUF3987 domain-containing protein [Nostoc sp. NMS7]MBN3949951.1 DUF3987 domain-containing protein [Nostoc sp. NMS7]
MIAQVFAPEKNLKVDRHQIAKQLELLGYKPGEKVFLRAFYPSNDPPQRDGGGRKTNHTTIESIAQTAERFQNEGRGIYLVVNGGGQTDAEVETCRAIFYEHDNLSKDLQLSLWQSKGLPEPTFQVDTGGKSIHSYWVFNEPIDPSSWRSLQSDLLEFADGDRSLKNPSRVMRLAGCYHLSSKGVNPSLIVSESGTRYKFEEMRSIVPTQQKTVSPSLPLPLSTFLDVPVPLIECIPKADRELVIGGATEGGRNTTGYKLACSLIGAEVRLPYLGIAYTENARDLFNNYRFHCTPPLEDKEAEQVWKSAIASNPTATLTDDAILNCVKAWQRNQGSKPSGRSFSSSNVIQFGGTGNGGGTPPTTLELRDRVLQIMHRTKTQSEYQEALIKLSQKECVPIKELEKLAKNLESEHETVDARVDHQSEIDRLIKLGEGTLKLSDYLPQTLAVPLSQYSEQLNVRAETILLALLATTSSLHEVGTELVIHKTQGFTVPPTIMAAMVAESGQKKSPITRQIVSKPLAVLKREAREVYQSNLEQYQIDLEDWEKQKADTPKGEKFTDSKPIEPAKAPIFYFTDANGEGIKQQAQNAPRKSLYALVDELAGFFNSADKYRGGRGSDKQDLLSYYDGTGQTVLRSSGVKVDVEKIYLSIFGTIQPDVIRSIMRNCDDPDGQWARFLYVQQPLAASVLGDDDGSGVDIVDLLAGIYRKLHNTSARQYTLTREAFRAYQPYYNKLEQMRESHPHPGMRATYSKAEGYTGRLALNLHVLHELANGKPTMSTEIPVERMKEAIALMNFFIGQTKLLYSTFDEGIAPHIAKMIELSKRREANTGNGWLKASDIQRSYNTKSRPTADVVRSWMREAEALGFGQTRGMGIKVEFSYSTGIVDLIDKNRPKIDPPPIPENLMNEGLQKKVDIVDFKPTHQEPTKTQNGQSDPTHQEAATTENGQSEKAIFIDSPPTFCEKACNPCTDSVEKIDPPSIFGLFLSTEPIQVEPLEAETTLLGQSEKVDPPSTFCPTNSESPTFSPEAEAIALKAKVVVAKGATVRFKCLGSTRDGLTATVRYVKADGECSIQFHDQSLPAHLRSHLCPASMLEEIQE